ncbi:hypothetical protein LOC50_01485 [Pseudoalteromonas sp. SCSIO 43095]|uniref:hypothetical protein n=1 Tax=Pseudoalteromonas sp. SCSIO 43095 TaxID=2894202 RepID=UPI00202B4D05|nr:hypothetical protein [Pseudoalteromonas sp. SCSIO 43095]URQ99015.1 hypothetical protein LOC50_01485 [Pseudoalteromonas sp. SCSIO 43095]
MLFFPSITFRLIDAEVFPWALFFTLLCVIIYNKISKAFLLLLFIFSLSALYAAYLTEGEHLGQLTRSFLAYINSTFIIFTLAWFLNKTDNLIWFKKLLRFILFFYIIVGLLQTLGFGVVFDPIIALLKERGGGSGVGSRGVSILSTEPSRAAYEFIFIYAMFRFLDNGRNNFLKDIFVGLFIVFIIKSALGLIVYLVFMSFMHIKFKNLINIALYATSTIALIFLLNLLYDGGKVDYGNVRSIQIIIGLMSLDDLFTSFEYLVINSGFRGVSVISSYNQGLTTFFGYGVGNWEQSSLLAMKAMGIDEYSIGYFKYTCGQLLCPVRPTAYLAAFALDVGLIGFSFFIIYLLTLKVAFKAKPYKYFTIFCLLISSVIGHPAPWMLLGILTIYQKKRVR